MAGDWIKWVKGLARRPEVLHMAHLMNRSRHEVAGLICEFWEWADDNVSLSDEASVSCPGFVRIQSASNALVDSIAGAEGFANALSAVGWLIVRDGSLEFPKFARHNGKSGKARALDAERKRRERGQKSGNSSGSKPDKKRTREEKRREEKNSNPPSSPANDLPELPPVLKTPEFQERLKQWLTYKGPKAYKPEGLAALVSRAASLASEHGTPAVCAAIERAMANGWKGWDQTNAFEVPKGAKPPPKPPPPNAPVPQRITPVKFT